jgi:hypothetical protein
MLPMTPNFLVRRSSFLRISRFFIDAVRGRFFGMVKYLLWELLYGRRRHAVNVAGRWRNSQTLKFKLTDSDPCFREALSED